MPYLKAADGTDLFYTDWPGGKPIVFVHAWALNSCMWDYQIPDLTAAGFRCITFDRRGHGRSDRPGVGYDLDALADDLASVLETLDLSNVTLVAHSLGTCEAVRYLSRHGDGRIERLVLSGTLMPYLRKTDDNQEGIDPAILDQSSALLKRDVGAFMDAYPGEYYDVEKSISEELVAWTRRQISETPLPILLATNGPFDMRGDLPNVTVPALILHGTDDISAPIDFTARRVAKLIQNSRLVVFRGAGHGVYTSRASEYNAKLMAFANADASSWTGIVEELLFCARAHFPEPRERLRSRWPPATAAAAVAAVAESAGGHHPPQPRAAAPDLRVRSCHDRRLRPARRPRRAVPPRPRRAGSRARRRSRPG